MTGRYDDSTPYQGNEYIGMEVLLPIEDGYQRTIVAHRKCNLNGELIGIRNAKPIFYTRMYESLVPDGEGLVLSANLVDESIITSCDL